MKKLFRLLLPAEFDSFSPLKQRKVTLWVVASILIFILGSVHFYHRYSVSGLNYTVISFSLIPLLMIASLFITKWSGTTFYSVIICLPLLFFIIVLGAISEGLYISPPIHNLVNFIIFIGFFTNLRWSWAFTLFVSGIHLYAILQGSYPPHHKIMPFDQVAHNNSLTLTTMIPIYAFLFYRIPFKEFTSNARINLGFLGAFFFLYSLLMHTQISLQSPWIYFSLLCLAIAFSKYSNWLILIYAIFPILGFVLKPVQDQSMVTSNWTLFGISNIMGSLALGLLFHFVHRQLLHKKVTDVKYD